LIGAPIGNLVDLQMKEFSNVLQLVLGHGGERRHALFRDALADVWNQFFAVVVAQNLVRCDQVGPGCAASLRSVAECAIALEHGRSASGGGFVRLRAETEKCAGGGGALFGRHVLIVCLALRRSLIARGAFLGHCSKGRERDGKHGSEKPAPPRTLKG
jgi:hypothetical protein